MKKCFVISQIGEEGSEIRDNADKVLRHIVNPVCEECRFEVIRVDQINQSDAITQTILDQLNDAELVIADLSGHNPNAFYEMGYRACTGKPMIHIKEKNNKLPFDVASIRAFDYDLQDLDSVADIKERLKQTIISFDIAEDLEDAARDDTNKKEKYKETDASQMLPILYTIQDQISQLREEIHNKDTETIETIVRASQSNIHTEDVNTTLAKVLIPELIRDPQGARNLVQLSKIFKENE